MSGLTFVAFEPREEGFVASVPLEQLDALGEHPEALLRAASETYKNSIGGMRSLLADIDALKTRRIPISARKIWELGDAVLDLISELEQYSMELDGLYDHLVRDLGMKERRWNAIITFRRYLADKGLIPETLGWRRCERYSRQVAESLSKGLGEY